MPGAAEKKWDHTVEMDLLVAMVHGNQESDRVKHKWDTIATHMTNMGHSFTKDAISQHFTKVIMKDFKKRHGNNLLATSTPKKPVATPKKRSSAKRTKVGLSSNDDDEDDDGDDNDDEMMATPSKKPKILKAEEDQKMPVIKKEHDIRERSATVMPHDIKFEDWVNECT